MFIRCFLAGLGLFFCAQAAWSATAAGAALPGDRELIRDRQERVLQEQRKRLEELQQLPDEPATPAPTAPDPGGPCIPLQDIELQDARLISPAQRRALLEPFARQCLDRQHFDVLLQRITQHYIERGYVTSRAYLPQQPIEQGRLRIVVVEGRLEGLDGSAMASPRELAMASPTKAGDVLDLRQLEQLVEQISRLPSRAAQLELAPGSDIGASRVHLEGEPAKPWRVGFNRHNDGQKSTGEQQWGMNLDWDSPLGLADQLSLRGGGDTVSDHWRHSASQSLSYSLPYGWWTLGYSYGQSYYRTRNQGQGFSFSTHGESKQQQWRLERVLHRDHASKTGLNLGLSHLRTRNYLENSLLEHSSHRLSESQLGFNHGRRIANAFVNLDLGWQQGIGALDAQREGNPRSGQPTPRYNKYSLTLSYLQPFELAGERWSFDSLVNAQRSEDVLYGPQRISLGGQSSVRGFKEQSLSGDSGGYWRNQLRWSRPVQWAPLQPWVREYAVAFAYDLGVISGGRYNAGQHGRLSGNALEFSARGQYFAASLSVARSLVRPDAIERREHPLSFRVDVML